MTNALTNHTKDGLLDYLLQDPGIWASKPTAWYVALFSGISDIPAGTVTELSGNGYARQVVSFDSASDGVAVNSSSLTFGPATADWDTVTYFGVYDAITSGNLLFAGALDRARIIYDDDTLTVNVGAISVTLPS